MHDVGEALPKANGKLRGEKSSQGPSPDWDNYVVAKNLWVSFGSEHTDVRKALIQRGKKILPPSCLRNR